MTSLSYWRWSRTLEKLPNAYNDASDEIFQPNRVRKMFDERSKEGELTEGQAYDILMDVFKNKKVPTEIVKLMENYIDENG